MWNVHIKVFSVAASPCYVVLIMTDGEMGRYRMIHRDGAQNEAVIMNEDEVEERENRTAKMMTESKGLNTYDLPVAILWTCSSHPGI